MMFSVIVTVYKIEPAFLKKCVESILAQSDPDFELILVDDGSPDRCPALCDFYAARDSRVRVIHRENGGQPSARFSGVAAALGDYIVYVDGDDWLDLNFLLDSRRIIEWEAKPDLVTFGYLEERQEESRPVSEPLGEGLYAGKKKGKRLDREILMDVDMRHMAWSLWGKAFRRELLLGCQRQVDKRLRLGEDLACIVPFYLRAGRVYVSEKCPYHYRIRGGSDSRSFRLEVYDQTIWLLASLAELKDGLPADFAAQTDRYACFICFGILLGAVNERKYEQIGRIKEYMALPVLRERIRRARFRHITKKTRLTFALFRKNWIRSAYIFLWICDRLKRR